MNDLKFAFRQLLKNPGFTAVAVLTLALGIGANTAIFSVANAVLLRPFPYRNSERLVWVFRENPSMGYHWIAVTPGRIWNLQERNTCFSELATVQPKDFTLLGDGKPQQLRGICVSANLTEVLGVQPVLGRGFRPEEASEGNHRVALLGYGIWQRLFGGDPKIVGKTIRSDTETFTVVGVLPQRLNFPLGTMTGPYTTLRQNADIWTPAAWGSDQKSGQSNDGTAHVLARLKPGVTIEQADVQIGTLTAQWEQAQKIDMPVGWAIRTQRLEEQIARPVRPLMFLLLGSVSLVLLIACLNVANLFLVRGSTRHKEKAVRAALGASRFQIIRQLLTESLLYGLLGGACGLLLAYGGIRPLVLLLPPDLPRLNETHIDLKVLCFAAALSILAGLLFGSAPALQATQVSLNESLKESGRGLTATLRSHRLRNSLVVAEIALSLMLLAAAGLLIRSFLHLNRVQPGFDAEHVLAMNLTFSSSRFPEAATREAFTRQLLARLEALPGVRSAAASMGIPLAGGRLFSNRQFLLEGQPIPARGDEEWVRWRGVSPRYFSTMGIPLLKGRDFDDRDKPIVVAIVSESFARQFCGGREPIGLRCNLGEIIGVVGDCRDLNLDAPPEPRLYLPAYDFPNQSIVVGAVGDPRSLAAAVEATVLALDKDQPIQNLRPLIGIVSDSISQRRSQTMLLGLLAGVALMLAAVGIYGVMASLVIERTHEIGVRMALGAQAGDVFRLVVRNGMWLAAMGVMGGLAGALALTRLISHHLYAVTATDPLTLVGVTFVMTGIAFLACWLPARRAARVDPMEALRYE